MTQTMLSDSRWSTFVEERAKDASLYYSRAWLDLIATLYGYTVIPLTAINESGHITGSLPLCFIQSLITGRRLVALPFSDHCPLVAIDEYSANDLVEQAINLAQREKVRSLELRTGINEVLAKRADFVEENLYVRWLLPLPDDPDIAWSGLRKPIQHQIKKSQKLGVQVRIAQHREEMADYYQLHLQTRCKKHGMPAQPLALFFNLWDTFAASGAIQLLLAEYQGDIVAGMVLFASGTSVRYAYSASEERYLYLAPNNLLLWTAIRWGCLHGYQMLDLGRTARDNEGLMEFKRRWGAIEESLPYYYYPRTAGLAATSERNWKFRLLTSCWRKLPLQVAGPLGSHFYKHLG